MRLSVKIRLGRHVAQSLALIDSGATENFIHPRLIAKLGILRSPLSIPITVRNADNSENVLGKITHFTTLRFQINGHEEISRFLISDIGSEQIMLGLPWLRKHNPRIDWRSGEWTFADCPPSCTLHGITARVREHFGPLLGAKWVQRRFKVKKPVFSPTIAQELLAWFDDTLLVRRFVSPPPCDGGEEIHLTFLPPDDELSIRRKETQAQQFSQQYDDKQKDTTIPDHYRMFSKVFSEEASTRLPMRRTWDHMIELKPDAIPTSCKIYPLALHEQKALEDFLSEHLKRGTIRQSKSPMASPFFFIKKKDGKLRPVQDYRKLNDMTIKNQYPLPLIPELINRMKDAKIFTKFDVRWGYNNVRIKEGDEWKAAFKTNKGLFEPLVMFFGLTNSPATFQTMMNTLFKDLIDEGFVTIYMDDILIATATLEQHRRVVKQVLKILQDNDLYLKPEKCSFEQSKIDYLGVIIEEGQVRMDPSKVKGIQDWPAPKSLKEVRGFLGFCNFYRQFIKDFAKIARPLNDLTKKSEPFIWTETRDKAFHDLKTIFLSEPVLKQPDLNKPFILETDASKFATGGVLFQADEKNALRPCAFFSHSLNPAERNYEIYDRELLAIVRAFKEWRQFLAGAEHQIAVRTDHKNLAYWKKPQDVSPRQARWKIFLEQFDYKLYPTPGKLMVSSDALSRRPDHIPEFDDNLQQMILPTEVWTARQEGIEVIDSEWTDLINKSKAEWDVIPDIVRRIFDKILPASKAKERKIDLTQWDRVDERVITNNKRIYVPKDDNIKRAILKHFHDSRPYGHAGQWKTIQLIRNYFWWPGLSDFTRKYIVGCATCQEMKNITRRPTIPSIPILPDENAVPFSTVSIDFITDLPKSNDFDSILMVVDHDCSKAFVPIPCTKDISTIDTAELYLSHIWKRFGLPKRIISDRGTQFTSKLARDICDKLGVKQAMSTAYHPQTDGQTERANQELEQYLRTFCNFRQTDWAKLLPFAEFQHNSTVQSTLKKTPFEVLMGYLPTATFPLTSNLHDFPDRLRELQKIREEAIAAQLLAKQALQDIVKNSAPLFKPNDKVWLDGKNLRTSHPSHKLAPRRYGPFKILAVINPVAYKLQLPPQWKVHPVFHASLLTAYKTTSEHGLNPDKPPPDVEGDDEFYHIDHFVNSRWFRTRLQYLVHWTGYSAADDEWLFADDLKADLGADSPLFGLYHQQFPDAPSLTNRQFPRRRLAV